MAEQKKPSDAQVAANRRNAQRPTGPRTKEGKARSSANATRHGLYARELRPLMVGPLAEDHEEFYERAEDLIASFDPTNALEFELAKRATSALMRMKRLDAFEAAMDEITAMPDETITRIHGDLRGAEMIVYGAESLVEYIEAKRDDRLDELDWIDYEHLARKIREHAGELVVPGFWDATTEPSTDEKWAKVVDALLAHLSLDGDGGLRWAKNLRHIARLHHAMIEHRSKGTLARRLVNSATETMERPRMALWREFNNAVRQLMDIRKVYGEVDDAG